MPMAAVWTGLARTVLVLQHEPYPFSVGFVLDIGTDFAVIPLADFLVARAPIVDAISDIADIPQDDSTGLALSCDINDSPADLVFQVAPMVVRKRFHRGGNLASAKPACNRSRGYQAASGIE
jgi:hypothetical protein